MTTRTATAAVTCPGCGRDDKTEPLYGETWCRRCGGYTCNLGPPAPTNTGLEDLARLRALTESPPEEKPRRPRGRLRKAKAPIEAHVEAHVEAPVPAPVEPPPWDEPDEVAVTGLGVAYDPALERASKLRRLVYSLLAPNGSAAKRWDALLLFAPNDAQVLALARDCLKPDGPDSPNEGRSTEQEPVAYCWRASPPQIWLGVDDWSTLPDLHGGALAALCRRLFAQGGKTLTQPDTPKPAPKAPPVYGWSITYSRNDGKPDEDCHYVGTEKVARKKALLRPHAREVLRCEPMTEEQYVRVFGRGRM